MVGTSVAGTRYNSCTNTATINTKIGYLEATRTDVIAHLDILRNNLDDSPTNTITDVKDRFNEAATVANDFQNNKWTTFQNAVTSTIDLVSDPNTGLLFQLECCKNILLIEWIGLRWQDLDKSLCDSTVPNMAIIGMSLLIASFFNIFVVICGGCIAIRLKADSEAPRSPPPQ